MVQNHHSISKRKLTEGCVFENGSKPFIIKQLQELLLLGLKGVEHREEAELQKLKELQSSTYFNNVSEEELLEALF